MISGVGRERVAWVESPLQLINAIELAASDQRPLVVQPRAGVAQLQRTIAEVSPRLPEGLTILSPSRAAFTSTFRRSRHRVIGDAFSGQVRLLTWLRPPARLTLIDDGSATLHFARALRANTGFVRMAQTEGALMRALGTSLKRRLLAKARAGDVELFTAYFDDAEVRALKDLGFRITPNRFAWLGSLPPALEGGPSATVVVLGSAMVTDRQISDHDYLHWVASVSSGESTVYLPHRRESRAMLDRIDSLPGLTLVETGLPAELVLASYRQLARVVTLPSSAVATLRAVVPPSVTIEVARVPASWWLPSSDPALRTASDTMSADRHDETRES